MRSLILAVLISVPGLGASGICRAQEPVTTPPVSKHKTTDVEQLRKSINQLTTENERLRTKIAELERQLRNQSIRDRMTQEEQRAERLQEQLFSITKEEGDLQGQLDEVNEQLRSENLDRMQVMGSLRPEEVRESTRRNLTNRQSRLHAQLQLLQQSRTRIQSSLSVTDMLIQNLRMQLQSAAHP